MEFNDSDKIVLVGKKFTLSGSKGIAWPEVTLTVRHDFLHRWNELVLALGTQCATIEDEKINVDKVDVVIDGDKYSFRTRKTLVDKIRSLLEDEELMVSSCTVNVSGINCDLSWVLREVEIEPFSNVAELHGVQ